MNLEIANALSIYFKTLFVMNQRLIIVCGMGDKNFEDDKTFLDILHDIPRMIPFSTQKGKTGVHIQNRNGLLEFGDKIDYLKSDYETIIANHQDTLIRVNRIRNKSEHNMHRAAVRSLHWHNRQSCDFTYDLKYNLEGYTYAVEKEKGISINSDELINLFKDLNLLFSKLQKDVITFAQENNLGSYAYTERLSRFDFADFNQIYDSELLRIVCKVMVGY